MCWEASVAHNDSATRVEDRSCVYENGRVLFEYDINDRLERERFYAPGARVEHLVPSNYLLSTYLLIKA